jgi:hypothetical protein
MMIHDSIAPMRTFMRLYVTGHLSRIKREFENFCEPALGRVLAEAGAGLGRSQTKPRSHEVFLTLESVRIISLSPLLLSSKPA